MKDLKIGVGLDGGYYLYSPKGRAIYFQVGRKKLSYLDPTWFLTEEEARKAGEESGFRVSD